MLHGTGKGARQLTLGVKRSVFGVCIELNALEFNAVHDVTEVVRKMVQNREKLYRLFFWRNDFTFVQYGQPPRDTTTTAADAMKVCKGGVEKKLARRSSI